MKKIKKIVATSALVLGSAIGMVGCGEVYVSFDTDNAGDIPKIVYDKATFEEDVEEKVSNLAKPGYEIGGIYLDEDFQTPLSAIGDVQSDITLYIKWVPANILLKFDANGGTGTMNDQNIKYTNTANITSNTSYITKKGYSFAGWNTKADGTGQDYADGAEYTMNSINPVTLYAKWTINNYNITYNKNSAEAQGNAIVNNFTFGNQFTITSEKYTRDGYVLAGWNTKADGTGTTYQPGNTLTMNEEGMELFAIWRAAKLVVSFDANGGEGYMNPMKIDYNNTGTNLVSNSNYYTRTGYVFTGWNTKADGTGTTYADGAEFLYTIDYTEPITLYAQWQEATNKVVFNKNGADVVGTAINIDITGAVFVIPADEYTKPDHEFTGWNTKADGTGTTYYAESMVIDTEGCITLYAQWVRSEKLYDDSTIADLYTNYTMDDTLYHYAMIKGKSYTFPNVNILSVTNESSTGIATISDNTLTINASGSFKLTLANAEDETDIYEYLVYAMDNTSTITYFLEDGEQSVKDNSWENFADQERFSYQYDQAKDLQKLIITCYDFTGWVLMEDSYIGGQLVESGTNIGRTIPAKSFGNIKLKASFKTIYNNIFFHSGNEVIATLNGQYQTSWEDCSGYNEDTLTTNMISNAPAGKMFAGWYTHVSDFDSDRMFDGKVGENDLHVYARYIDNPAQVTNLALSDTYVLSWDQVEAPEGVTIKYNVVINNGDPYTLTQNAMDISTIINSSANYTFTVNVIFEIKNNAINQTWSSVSAPTEISEDVSINTDKGIIVIKEGDTTTKNIFFTGMTYNFDFDSEFAEEDIRLLNVKLAGSEEALDTILEEVENTDTSIAKKEVMQNELFTWTKITYVGGNIANKIVISETATGSFDLTQSGRTGKVQIVENVSKIEIGDSYRNYLNAKKDTSDFLDKENISTNGDYLVGSGNEFSFDLKFYNTQLSQYSTNYNIADSELVKFVFEVQDEEDNWINADNAYYNVASNTFSTTQGDGDVSASVTRNGDKFQFNNQLGQYGVSYKVTVYLMYSYSGKNPTEININDIDLTQFKDKVEFNITLNTGVNVYTNEELKEAYGDFTKHVINVHRDIVAELDEHQAQADGSPINTQSDHVFDNDDTVSNNATTAGEKKTDGNIYKRASRSVTNDKIVVNGNNCTIDASNIKLVNVDYNTQDTAASNGVNAQTGFKSSSSIRLLRGQTGIFRYQCPKATNGKNENVAIFNDLNIIGNKPNIIIPGGLSTSEYQARANERELANSGSLVGIYNENSNVIINNSNILHTHHAIRVDSAYVIQDGMNGTLEINYTNIEDTYLDAVFGWNGKCASSYNSKFTECGGFAIHMNDTFGTAPIVTIDKNTIIDNYKCGSETWFTVYGMSTLATRLKAMLQPTFNAFGASILKDLGDTEYQYFNMVYCYNPTDLEKNVDYYTTTNTDGIKKVCDVDDARRVGYIYDDNGNIVSGYYNADSVVGSRKVQEINSSDRRVSQNIFAFANSEANTADRFNALAGTLSYMSTNVTNTPVTKYMSGVMSYDTVIRLCDATDTARISEVMFESLADYVIEQYTANPLNPQLSQNGAFEYLVGKGILQPTDLSNEKVMKQLMLLWNSMQTPINDLNSTNSLGISPYLLANFGTYSIVELKLNAKCNNPTSGDFSACDYSDLQTALFQYQFAAKYGAEAVNFNKDLLSQIISMSATNTATEIQAGLKAVLSDLFTMTVEQVQYVLDCADWGYMGISDNMLLDLMNELIHVSTAMVEGQTVQQYLGSNVAHYILYRLGTTFNGGNDRLVELAMPTGDSPNLAPMVIFAGSGTLTDDADPTTEMDDWMF